MMRKQQGVFLIVAALMIMIIGVVGMIVAYSFANRARMSVNQQSGLQAFYVAESGLEITARLLVGSSLVGGQSLTCATVTGASLVTNAAVLNGTFTATAVNNALYSTSTSLSSAITATSNSLTISSATGLAPHGRVRIDSEAIDYASISGNTLVGLNRGTAGTIAASHALGAAVSQSVCLINVKAGIPSIASPSYRRELEMAVEILSSSDVWGVGARHGNQFSAIRWNTPLSNVWNDVSPSSDITNREDLLSVSASSVTNGWAVGVQKGSNFTMVRWAGSSWTPAPLSGACNGQDLEGVAVTSAIEAWAVGLRARIGCSSSSSVAYRPAFLRWNGSSWTVLTSPSIPTETLTTQNLNAVSVYDSNNDGLANFGFAVGDAGTIWRYTGSSWVVSTSGTTNNLYGVAVVSGIEAWAVGAGGIIRRWNGSSWSSVSSPTTNQLNSISMVDLNNDGVAEAGFAVGNGGTILYYNGSTWTTQPSTTTNNLSGVTALNSSSAFALGLSNTLIRYTSGSWGAATPPTSFSATYYGITSLPGGAVVTGTQVGSWQQIFR